MKDAQSIQERQYSFPYHHVAQFRGGFQTSYYVKYGLKHATSLSWIIDQVKKLAPQSIIDVGCGDGRLVLELDRDLPQSKILGIDYSERSIHLAKGMHPTGNFQQLDILNEAVDQRFDLATLIEVFEHIPPSDCKRFSRRLGEIVKSGGHLMITVPHVNTPVSPKHFQHFTKDSLLSYFVDDFVVDEIQFLEKRGGWRLYLYYRMLKNKLFLLNNQRLLNWIYRGYTHHHLLASGEDDCERLYLLLKRK